MDEHPVNEETLKGSEAELGITWENLDDTFRPPVRPLIEFVKEIDLKGISPEFAPYVFFENASYEQMLRDASRDVSREHGGILLGEAYEDPGGRYYVVIQSAVAADESKGSSTHLRFRPESWKPIWDKLHSDRSLKIVGWYHTHPRLGVFLSGTDLRTQLLYFSSPWNIAIVIDPVSAEVGCFWGSSGKKAPFFRQFSHRRSGQTEAHK